MKIFALLLSVFVTTSAFAATTRADTSLYDPHAAFSVVTKPTTFDFGPKSSGLRYDKRMIRAAEIAAQRARPHSISRCWRYVKDALVAAKVVDSRPTTQYAKEAGEELRKNHGFTKTRINNPFKAPIGSVLVYGGRGAGHVEIRTAAGFVSDFTSMKPSPRPLIGVYIKPS